MKKKKRTNNEKIDVSRRGRRARREKGNPRELINPFGFCILINLSFSAYSAGSAKRAREKPLSLYLVKRVGTGSLRHLPDVTRRDSYIFLNDKKG
jgi:hypothetical protein